jgi:hypothetical protein
LASTPYQVENLKNAGHPSNIDHFRRAAVQISEGIATADSIDDFLHRCERRPDADAIRLSGKLGIARCILNAERSSHLHYSTESMFNKMDLNKLTATWYMKMFRLLVRHHTDAQQIFENVSFINFNYDRCLEYFFLNALMPAFGLSAQDAIDLTKTARIFHPYGITGALPVLAQLGTPSAPFGAESPVDLLSIAKQIRTYTERWRISAPSRQFAKRSRLLRRSSF